MAARGGVARGSRAARSRPGMSPSAGAARPPARGSRACLRTWLMRCASRERGLMMKTILSSVSAFSAVAASTDSPCIMLMISVMRLAWSEPNLGGTGAGAVAARARKAAAAAGGAGRVLDRSRQTSRGRARRYQHRLRTKAY